NLNDGVMTLETGGKTYRLAPFNADDPQSTGAFTASGSADGNPLGAGQEPAEDPKPIASKKDEPSSLPGQWRLKLATIPDISMGNVTAATVLVPDGWDCKGQVEWRGSPTPYAQRAIQMESKDGCSIEFPSPAEFQYLEFNGQQQGDPPPQDVGQWIA